MRRRLGATLLVAGLASAVALSGATAAQAATKTVVAGPPGTANGTFGGSEPAADLDTFSLKQVVIHRGDKVRWQVRGFHTVTFPKKGGGVIPFLGPDPAAKYSGVNGADGAPFWFNDVLPQINADPRGALPQGGKTEDGTKLTGSGLPASSGPPAPYTLRFPKTGTFTYICVVHPGMRASVKVVRKGKRIPTASHDRKVAAARLAKDAKTARKLGKFTPPAGTVSAGHDKGGVVRLGFFPSTAHVAVGGALKLEVTSKIEAHTFSFGPPAYLGGLVSALVTPVPNPAGPPTLKFNGQIAYPSDPPPANVPYTGTNHGNGFFNTGVLDGDAASPNPSSMSVTFSQPGSYAYICLLHPWMRGTVVVG